MIELHAHAPIVVPLLLILPGGRRVLSLIRRCFIRRPLTAG